MRPCSPALFLALLLLVTASAAGAQAPLCQTEVRRIELSAGAAPPPELCISPGLTTTILFDQGLAPEALALDGRERFLRVETSGSLLVLLPGERLVPGERLKLTVRFTGAGVPEKASFVLVVYREQAERQVEVSHPRSSNSCQAELQRKEAELQRCLDERASLPAHANFASLLDKLGLGLASLPYQQLTFQGFPEAAGADLQVVKVMLYSLRDRSVLRLHVRKKGGKGLLQLAGATLVASSGEVTGPLEVSAPLMMGPGYDGDFWVEVSPGGHPDTSVLELRDGAGQRIFTVKELKLP